MNKNKCCGKCRADFLVRDFCIQQFPFIAEDFDALTTYEILMKVICYLKDLGENVQWLYDKLAQLDTEMEKVISDKIEEMYQNGDFAELFIRYGYLLSVKVFGAVGDGVTDDTQAFTDFWNDPGGLKYIPPGDYLVNGEILHFDNGAIGNGQEYPLPDRCKELGEENYDKFAKKAVVFQGQYVTDKDDLSGLIRLSFTQELPETHSVKEYNHGVTGVEITGNLKGYGNGMPIGVRASMYNGLNGDGDIVGLWARVHKFDPDCDHIGANLSDSCAVHASAVQKSQGTGLVMALETWARNMNEQGSRGTNYSSYYNAGGVVGLHSSARSDQGMNQAHILCSQAGAYQYGAWSIMSINPTCFKYDGNTAYPERTAIIKSPDCNFNQCPNFGLFLGAMPYHVKMLGGYQYSMGADQSEFVNSTYESPATGVRINTLLSGDTENDSNKRQVLSFTYAKPNEENHSYAKNVGTLRQGIFRIYTEYNHPCMYFRTEIATNNDDREPIYKNQTNLSRDMQFQIGELNSEGVSVFDRGVRISGTYNSFYPLVNNSFDLGLNTRNWKDLYLTGSVISASDERLKCDIENIDERLFEACDKINFKQFKYKKAVEKKGENARLHIGVIAQDIIKAFESVGLNAFEYGLVCINYDTVKPEETRVIDRVVEPEYDEDENEVVKPEYVESVYNSVNKSEKVIEYYSVRYDELNCLYLWYLTKKIENLY